MRTIGHRCAAAWLAACLAICLTGCNEWSASPSVPAFALQPNAAQLELGTSLPLATTLADPASFDFRWDFGDGSTSAEPKPAHVYANAGRYDISLVVSTRDGIQSEGKTSSVQVGRFAMVRGKSCSGANSTGWCFQQATMPLPDSTVALWSDTITGLALNLQGMVQRTTDGGMTWVRTSVSGLVQLMAAGFADRNTGWLVGTGRDSFERVFVTTDGGANWTEQTVPQALPQELPNSYNPYDPPTLTVVNANVVVINNNASSLVTRDGGKVWSLQNYRHDAITLPAGTRWRRQTIGGVVNLMKSTDLGQTEASVLGGPYRIRAGSGVYFSDDAHAWVFTDQPDVNQGSRQILLRTADGGATWVDLGQGPLFLATPPRPGESAVQFFDPLKGWAHFLNGIGYGMQTTRDGGSTWTTITTIPANTGNAVTALSAQIAIYPTSSNAIMLTRDMGMTWKPYSVPQETAAYRVTELAPDGAVRMCYAARCFETRDEGSSWQIVRGQTAAVASADAAQYRGLRGIWFFDARHGIADAPDLTPLPVHSFTPTQYPSTIAYQTRDGGASWSFAESTDHVRSVRSLQTLSADLAWSTYLDTTAALPLQFRSTVDGGATWQIQTAAPALTQFHFVDASQGWGLGSCTADTYPYAAIPCPIYRTRDGGRTWQAISTLTGPVSTIRFFDASNGAAAGTGGLWRTRDGGITWQQTGPALNLSGVRFLDSITVWAWVQEEARSLYKSLDGGASWQKLTLPTTLASDFCFVSKDRGWLIGQKGVVFRTDDGGATWTAQDSGTTVNLNAITAIDAQTLWVTGDYGTIIATSTGGR